MDESPLFARAYDLVKESCIQSERMPRSRREPGRPPWSAWRPSPAPSR